ncbi:hypothetical protein QFZ55_006681 [Streptomyces luteogriseus]|nr:hypothetical protein [Streptomyces luteogriseus]
MGSLPRCDTVLGVAMAETVPVRCPVCRREHRYTAPAYPCVCGAPVAPRLDRGGPATPVSHRVWQDDWVTVRCGSCGRHGEWPRPEVGCACGVVLRVAVVEGRGSTGRAAAGDGEIEGGWGSGASGPDTEADSGGGTRRGRDAATDGRAADQGSGAGQGSAADQGSGAGQNGAADRKGAADRHSTPGREEAADRHSTPGQEEAADQHSTPGQEEAADQHSTPRREEAADRHSTPGQEEAADQHSQPGRKGAADQRSPARTHDTAPGPRDAAAATAAAGTPRPPFPSVTIRTARDAVAATALYLRWLGYRGVRRADQRPPSGIGLAARGVVAQVDPALRPATLRDVECLWLTAMTESADCLYFSLAGYADDACARADSLGVPLFVLDLTGTPRPVNAPAETLAAGGLGKRAP